MFGVIYGIENMLDHKIYIGQTIRNIKKRLKEHKNCKISLIGRAIHKYGWENFICVILEECDTQEDLDATEIRWIARLNCIKPNGYNLTEGGAGNTGRIFSQETRKKLSEMNKGKKLSAETKLKLSHAMKGRTVSPETRLKRSIIQTGRKLSDETKAKISASMSGRLTSEETRKKLAAASIGNKNALGCHRSEETRKKISATKKAYFAKLKAQN